MNFFRLTTDCTLLVGIDNSHLPELAVAWRSWLKYRPAICKMPKRFVCDFSAADGYEWIRRLASHGIECGISEIVGIYDCDYYANQREKMLTGLVRAVQSIETPWFLKLDTDTIATSDSPWFDDEWFKRDIAFVSSPWPYTKPASFVKACEEWADSHASPLLRANGPIFNGRDFSGETFVEPRIISYLFFGNTQWCSWAAYLSNMNRLPCASQDTYLWYVARRTAKPFITFKFKNMGWAHGSNAVRTAAKAQ